MVYIQYILSCYLMVVAARCSCWSFALSLSFFFECKEGWPDVTVPIEVSWQENPHALLTMSAKVIQLFSLVSKQIFTVNRAGDLVYMVTLALHDSHRKVQC